MSEKSGVERQAMEFLNFCKLVGNEIQGGIDSIGTCEMILERRKRILMQLGGKEGRGREKC